MVAVTVRGHAIRIQSCRIQKQCDATATASSPWVEEMIPDVIHVDQAVRIPVIIKITTLGESFFQLPIFHCAANGCHQTLHFAGVLRQGAHLSMMLDACYNDEQLSPRTIETLCEIVFVGCDYLSTQASVPLPPTLCSYHALTILSPYSYHTFRELVVVLWWPFSHPTRSS